MVLYHHQQMKMNKILSERLLLSNGVDEILLTFRQEEHILIVAKNVMILTLAKTKTPEVCYTSGVFYSFYVRRLRP